MNCTSCGVEMRPDMRFCVSCGQAVGAAPADGGLPPAPSPKSFVPVTPVAAVQESWVPHNDPHAIGMAVARLGSSARRASKSAVLLAATHLAEGERVESLVQGRVMGVPGVAVLTPHRILVVNEAEWKPLVHVIPLAPDVTVQGWEDERTASLLLQTSAGATTIDMIRDRLLAHEFAHRLRALVGRPQSVPVPAAPAPTAAPAPVPPTAPSTTDAASAPPAPEVPPPRTVPPPPAIPPPPTAPPPLMSPTLVSDGFGTAGTVEAEDDIDDEIDGEAAEPPTSF